MLLLELPYPPCVVLKYITAENNNYLPHFGSSSPTTIYFNNFS